MSFVGRRCIGFSEIFFVFGILLALLFVSCPSPDATDGADETGSASVTKVTVTFADGSDLFVGNTIKLNAKVEGSGNFKDSVTWSTGNLHVATVDKDGVVTGTGVGSTAITAKSDEDPEKLGSITVEVSAGHVTKVTVTFADGSDLFVGNTIKLNAKVEGSGNFKDSVTWSTGDPDVATVDKDGVVTGRGVGSTAITAKSDEDPKKLGSITVEVSSPIVTLEIKNANYFTSAGYRLTAGHTLPVGVEYTLTYVDGYSYSGTDHEVEWSSDDPDVASVYWYETNSQWAINPKKPGRTKITVTSTVDPGSSHSLALTVYGSYASGLAVSESGPISLGLDDESTFEVTVTTVGTPHVVPAIESGTDGILSITTGSAYQKPSDGTQISRYEITLEANKVGETTLTISADGYGTTIQIAVEVIRPDTITIETTWNEKKYSASKELNTAYDESVNIINLFIHDEDYASNAPLNLKVEATKLPQGVDSIPGLGEERNYSDTTAEIFEFKLADGSTSGKFRLNIFRRPIFVDDRPADNTDTAYDTSGASAVSVRKFVKSDYYYVPTKNADGEITDYPAPTFALFAKAAEPDASSILGSPVRILRNFTTSDGTTLFFHSFDDGIDDDSWPDGGAISSSADIITSLSPSSEYSLHWAVVSDNTTGDTGESSTYKGSLGKVTTGALPTIESGADVSSSFLYIGNGGMRLHPTRGKIGVSGLVFSRFDSTHSENGIYVYNEGTDYPVKKAQVTLEFQPKFGYNWTSAGSVKDSEDKDVLFYSSNFVLSRLYIEEKGFEVKYEYALFPPLSITMNSPKYE